MEINQSILKNDKDVNDFAREIYRMGLISLEEMQSLLNRIELLQSGKLVPEVAFNKQKQADA